MLLEFESDSGFQEVIGEPKSFNEAVVMIREYLNCRGFSPYYWEWMQGEDLWILDFGSYRNSVFLTNLNDNLIEEFNKFYERSN